ncbi:hypothetical protein C3489_22160 [Streptomyces sp. Ru71]|nr:hypothetical protein C3489_22160 [Streptomyces sp. Ru71]
MSAPPSATSIEGFTEPLGMFAGLSITDFLNFTVRAKSPPWRRASIWTGEVALLSPMGVLQA